MNQNKPAAGLNFSAKIQELWQGKVPLFQAFWLYYFAGVFVLAMLASTLKPLAVMLGLLAAVWSGFMVKPIFLAADAYKGATHWGLLAKAAAVLIAVAAFLRLGSMLLG